MNILSPATSYTRCVAQKVILDVDTGTDDAVALMLAALHPDLELIGATTVNGNVPVDVLHRELAAGLRLHRGPGPGLPGRQPADRPRRFPIPRDEIQSSRAVHGGYLDVPPSRSTAQSTGAVEFLIETYRAATEEIILVPVGPLSNIAEALAAEPLLKDRIPELVIMGGANLYGNVTPRAEFNIWADPEAARAVLNSGVRQASRSCPWTRLIRRSYRSTTAPRSGRSARPPARLRRGSRSGGSRATTRPSR